MNNISNHEFLTRGTPEFPIELYNVDKSHPRYNMQFHWHKDYEIILITEGSFELQLNDKKYLLKEGDSVFIPEGIMHGGIASKCKYSCLVFSPSLMYSAPKCRTIIKTYLTSPVILKNDTLTKNLFNYMNNLENGYEFLIISTLHMLIFNLLSNNQTCKITPNMRIEKIKKALSYIDNNYSSNITLKELAAECMMSPNYFCRFFKELTQETPFEYITRYRIEMACELIVSGMTVTDTAYLSGFNDISYFINVFKKHMGMSPKKYSNKNNETI